MTVQTWRERGSRSLAIGLMSQYETVAEALFEIIDNPVDYRLGRKLKINVTVMKAQDLIVVEDIGGEGMDDEGIEDWLNWGSGHPHGPEDIGMYHFGGKAATGNLGNHIRMLSRKAGSPTVWVFEDDQWATRPEWGDWQPRTLSNKEIPIHLATLPRDVGFVRIELRDLEKTRHYRLEDLRFRLSNVYRVLLQRGDVAINLNGSPIDALALPESTAFDPEVIDKPLPSGRRLRGRVWRLNRDSVVNSRFLKGGIRTLFKGRLITEGEYFGHYGEGKGLLASLIGEVHLDWCSPVPTKTAWRRDSKEWYEVEEVMKGILAPIIKAFREAAEKNPVSREDRKRVNDVHRQLNEALKRLATAGVEAGSAANDTKITTLDKTGRKRPHQDNSKGAEESAKATERTHGPTRNATPPPPDAVGKLKRLAERLDKAGGFPPLRLKPRDKAIRSATETEDGKKVIVINTVHPMYRDTDGAESYMAETAILEMLRPDDDGDGLRAGDYYGQHLQLLNTWYRVADSKQ